MATLNDKRKHPRLVHRAQIMVTYSNGQSEQLQMNDFSETGMFIKCLKQDLPDIGELMQVQTLEIDEAPLLNVRVTRVVAGQGFAVEFV